MGETRLIRKVDCIFGLGEPFETIVVLPWMVGSLRSAYDCDPLEYLFIYILYSFELRLKLNSESIIKFGGDSYK